MIENETRHTRRPGVTPAQQRYVRRLTARCVRGIGWQFGGDVFRRPEHAVCYALARHAPVKLLGKREAHEWIEELRKEKSGESIVALARRDGEVCREWRRRALTPLARRYGYPSAGWCDRLNAEIAETFGRGSETFRLVHADNDVHFRARIVDPLFAMPKEADGEPLPGRAA